MPASPSATPTPSMNALLAALSANSGATVTDLAKRAGLGRSTAARVLTALEGEGLARRERTEGGSERLPDLWFAASTTSDPGPHEPVGTTGTSDHAAAQDEAPKDCEPECEPVSQDAESSTPEKAQPEDQAEPVLSPAAPDEDGCVSTELDDAKSETSEAEVEHAGKTADQSDPAADGEPSESAFEVSGESDMAAEDAGEPPMLASAAEPGESDVDAGGETVPGAVPSETGAPRLAKGGLRALVAEVLSSHPEEDFTASKLGRVLEKSSGAIANALDTLVKLGQAEMTCEKPRTFRHHDNTAS